MSPPRRRRRTSAGVLVSTIISDTFTRANGAIGSAETGQLYVNPSGNYVVSANQAALSAGVVNQVAVANAAAANVTVQCTIAVWDAAAGTQGAGLAFRSSAAGTQYLYLVPETATSLRINKNDLGTFSVLTTVAFVPVNGDVMRVVLSGNNINVFQNGVLLISIADPSFAAQTYHGLAVGVGTVACRWDNLLVTVP
jgi:hypothetical protein